MSPRAALLLLGLLATGCDRSTPSVSNKPVVDETTEEPVAAGTGTLSIVITNPEGKPLADALVQVRDHDLFTANSISVGSGRTDANGNFTLDSVPKNAWVNIFHPFGSHYQDIDVAQTGITRLDFVLSPSRPLPTVALLPATLAPGGVSVDRSEVTFEVTLVASATAPFLPAWDSLDYASDEWLDYWNSGTLTPKLALELRPSNRPGYDRQCVVWLDSTRTLPSCGTLVGDSPYAVSVTRFDYDGVGRPAVLAEAGPIESAVLLMDQSARIVELDPTNTRSFAARAFIAREAGLVPPMELAVAGFAGDGDISVAPVTLPARPLWLPAGTDVMFTSDIATLQGLTAILEPYTGGSAPLFDALTESFTLTAAHASPANRAVVAVLGGSDDGVRTELESLAALTALREQQDDAAIQSLLIDGTPWARSADSTAIAEMSAALRAPVISLGGLNSWESGIFAALDLAADLIGGAPLPTLSATFVVSASAPDTFSSGSTLHGVLYVEDENCWLYCPEVPLEFVVEIP